MKIKANGIMTNYELSGRSGAPTVAFSHSLASSVMMWEPQLEALEGRYQVLRYDTRGHGASEPAPAPYSFELLAADLVGLLDALGVPRVHFVGLSMGGMIGQILGLTNPDRLLGLVLCDTSAATPPAGRQMWKERIEAVRREGLAGQLKPTMQRWFTDEFLARRPPVLEAIERQFLATPVEGYAGCGGALMAFDNAARTAEIRVPTLVLTGADDPGMNEAAARAMQEKIPGAKLAVIAKARHLPNVERPEEFNKALLGFLDSL
jgi:3-oxoadipate enol-lactonase